MACQHNGLEFDGVHYRCYDCGEYHDEIKEELPNDLFSYLMGEDLGTE